MHGGPRGFVWLKGGMVVGKNCFGMLLEVCAVDGVCEGNDRFASREGRRNGHGNGGVCLDMESVLYIPWRASRSNERCLTIRDFFTDIFTQVSQRLRLLVSAPSTEVLIFRQSSRTTIMEFSAGVY